MEKWLTRIETVSMSDTCRDLVQDRTLMVLNLDNFMTDTSGIDLEASLDPR